MRELVYDGGRTVKSATAALRKVKERLAELHTSPYRVTILRIGHCRGILPRLGYRARPDDLLTSDGDFTALCRGAFGRYLVIPLGDCAPLAIVFLLEEEFKQLAVFVLCLRRSGLCILNASLERSLDGIFVFTAVTFD